MAKSLYIPGQGEVSLEPKESIPVSRKEIEMLSWLHQFAFQQQINIFCKRCEKPITGQNNDSSPVLRVACQCREWIFSR